MQSGHHAQVVAVSTDTAFREYVDAARELRYESCERLTIDLVRSIREWITQTAADGRGKLVMVLFQSATREAQNALLKELEEPPANVTFILGTPEPAQLLPTLRSRLAWDTADTKTEETNEVFHTFQAQTAAERLNDITQKAKSKDHVWLDTVARGVVDVAAHTNERPLKELAISLDRYWSLPGTSKKMWLEHAALLLPSVKQQ